MRIVLGQPDVNVFFRGMEASWGALGGPLGVLLGDYWDLGGGMKANLKQIPSKEAGGYVSPST